MSGLTLLLIAIGVSADAFAVALAKGLQLRSLRGRDALALAVTFGAFQALMPLLGWLAGTGFRGAISGIDHWIAFGLLGLIGGRMIWEALHPGEADEERDGGIPLVELLVLGLATSIDALAVGISFAFLDVDIVRAVVTIGVITFGLTLGGVYVGHGAGTRFRKPAEVVGGVILILIGTRILLDHLGVI